MREIAIAGSLLLCFICISCRKDIKRGTTIHASGYVLDTVKNKRLSKVKLYLFGAHQTFYGIYYSEGPLDSTVSGANGNFSLDYRAEGRSIDYALRTSYLGYGGFEYGPGVNYAADIQQAEYKFTYQTQVYDVVLKARELNTLQLKLQVQSNPYDTLHVFVWASNGQFQERRFLKGQQLDTILYLRCLPNGNNYIVYQADRYGADSGWISRRITDTLQTDMADTVRTSKKINSIYSMPPAF